MNLVIDWKHWTDRLLFIAMVASIFCSLWIYQLDLTAIYTDLVDNDDDLDDDKHINYDEDDSDNKDKIKQAISSSKIQQQLLTAKIFLYGNVASTSMAGFYLLFRRQKRYLLALYIVGTIVLLSIRSFYSEKNYLLDYHLSNIIGLILATFRLYIRLYHIDTRTVFQLQNNFQNDSTTTSEDDDDDDQEKQRRKKHRKSHRIKSKKTKRKYSSHRMKKRQRKHRRSDIDVEYNDHEDDDEDISDNDDDDDNRT